MLKTVVLIFVFSLCAHSDTKPRNDTEIRTLMRMLLASLSEIMDEPSITRISLPRVFYKTQAELDELYFGNCQKPPAFSARALYFRNEVDLLRTFKNNSKNDQSYLLHELVHHVQYIMGDEFECIAQEEAQAYLYQNKWRVQNGLDDVISPSMLVVMSQCIFPGDMRKDC